MKIRGSTRNGARLGYLPHARPMAWSSIYLVRAGRGVLPDFREGFWRGPSGIDEDSTTVSARLAGTAAASLACVQELNHARSHCGGTKASVANIIIKQNVVRPVMSASPAHIRAATARTNGRSGRC